MDDADHHVKQTRVIQLDMNRDGAIKNELYYFVKYQSSALGYGWYGDGDIENQINHVCCFIVRYR
jgi:hypothetical protein